MKQKIYKNDDYTVWNTQQADGTSQYFLRYRGITPSDEIEINAELYNFYIKEARRPIEKQRNERRRHLDSKPLYNLDNAIYDPYENLDLQISLEMAYKTLTLLQKRYLTMSRVEGYSFVEIARTEGKQKSTIFRIVKSAERKIKKYLA